ncbi:MAG: hypothetical protein QNL26_05830, partial [Acidimicrobiia bacterium]|nr:hypothetical protein [Acidimicrobiia bacterium]
MDGTKALDALAHGLDGLVEYLFIDTFRSCQHDREPALKVQAELGLPDEAFVSFTAARDAAGELALAALAST